MKNKSKHRILIPRSQQFPKPTKSKPLKPVAVKNEFVEDAVLGNKNIDIKHLALLINICHIVADVNEQLSIEIKEILKQADPNLELQFQRSIKQILYHSSDMVKFVDKHTPQEFSEGFGEAADELKAIIMDYFTAKNKT